MSKMQNWREWYLNTSKALFLLIDRKYYIGTVYVIYIHIGHIFLKFSPILLKSEKKF